LRRCKYNAPGQVVDQPVHAKPSTCYRHAAERGLQAQYQLPVRALSIVPDAAGGGRMRAALDRVTIKPPASGGSQCQRRGSQSIRRPSANFWSNRYTGSVRWRESMLYVKAQGVDKSWKCGAGAVLAGLMKRIDQEVSAVSCKRRRILKLFLQFKVPCSIQWKT